MASKQGYVAWPVHCKVVRRSAHNLSAFVLHAIIHARCRCRVFRAEVCAWDLLPALVFFFFSLASPPCACGTYCVYSLVLLTTCKDTD